MPRSFELQGHRGARGLYPENTLAGFAATLALGVDSIELDVALTADGVAVVSHDLALHPDLTRGPDGAWITPPGAPIRSLTLAELGRYDVGRLRPGSKYARQFAEQAPQDGARIPTLAEIFSLTLPAGVRVSAEVKVAGHRPEDAIPATAAIIAAAGAAGALASLDIRSFDWSPLKHLRRHRPEVPLTWLSSGHPDPAAVAAAAGDGPPIAWKPTWAPAHADLTQALLAEAHALGLAVSPWTVNEPAEMARLIGWGVDGLCTDYPDRARSAMSAAGLPLPPPRQRVGRKFAVAEARETSSCSSGSSCP